VRLLLLASVFLLTGCAAELVRFAPGDISRVTYDHRRCHRLKDLNVAKVECDGVVFTLATVSAKGR